MQRLYNHHAVATQRTDDRGNNQGTHGEVPLRGNTTVGAKPSTNRDISP
jgi:hypothetical protein